MTGSGRYARPLRWVAFPLARWRVVCHIVRFPGAPDRRARQTDRSSELVEVWPAIDLRGGRCVRLRQGDYGQETVFGDDPAAMARHWVDLGAEYLHLVDLDGAREGKPANLPSVRAIVESVDVPCELGGGIRDEESIGMLLDAGLQRLVIGTLALRDPDWFRRMCRKHPGRLVLGIDARDGRVATDGMMAGPNLAANAAMQAAVEWPVVASGGVSTEEDIVRLAAVPMAGCIIGRALYEKTLTLPAALAAARGI